ncbi:MAG: iron complex transport system permease protein [Clostridiales bacterium]|jgi:iron complex transport system permease protein|nr:iron complex transport system permease protein [Clostridiales bacterium]
MKLFPKKKDISGRAADAADHFPKKKIHKRLLILVGLFCLIFLISFSIGRFFVPPSQVVRILFSRVLPLQPIWEQNQEIVVLNVRFPRIIAAALVGMSLSVAGSVYQGMFNNPMVSPKILGSSAGAAFGAALGIFMGMNGFGISAAAFITGTIAVFATVSIAGRYRSNPTLGLILAGIMISTLFTAGTSFIKLVADPTDELPAITYWLMGSLAGVRNSDLPFLVPTVFISIIPLVLMRWRLNVITVGDDEARALGVDTKKLRMIVILCATLMTAACVAISGLIGWVGLVIPHFSRKLVGCDYSYLLPASMLVGGGFLIFVDDLARTATTVEIPIGILTAFVGAPFFLYMIVEKGGNK